MTEGKHRKNKSVARLAYTKNYGEVSSDTILINKEDSKVRESSDHLTEAERRRLANLIEASLSMRGTQYRNKPVQLALELGCKEGGEEGFSRDALNAALRGDKGQRFFPGDWNAIAQICSEVETWENLYPLLANNGVTYGGRVGDLKAALALNSNSCML
jgi:hypothetical protein